jgi:hypothetical protein
MTRPRILGLLLLATYLLAAVIEPCDGKSCGPAGSELTYNPYTE